MNAYNLAIALSVMGHLECEEMSEWRDIETAPKDGTVVELTALQADGEPFEIWPMQWSHIQQNRLFPEAVGMWVSPDGSSTWNGSKDEYGPTHWREVE